MSTRLITHPLSVPRVLLQHVFPSPYYSPVTQDFSAITAGPVLMVTPIPSQHTCTCFWGPPLPCGTSHSQPHKPRFSSHAVNPTASSTFPFVASAAGDYAFLLASSMREGPCLCHQGGHASPRSNKLREILKKLVESQSRALSY